VIGGLLFNWGIGVQERLGNDRRGSRGDRADELLDPPQRLANVFGPVAEVRTEGEDAFSGWAIGHARGRGAGD
jgi:hypothetical protein